MQERIRFGPVEGRLLPGVLRVVAVVGEKAPPLHRPGSVIEILCEEDLGRPLPVTRCFCWPGHLLGGPRMCFRCDPFLI